MMKYTNVFAAIIFACLATSITAAQRPEIMVSVNEQFLDAAIDAILQKGEPPSHPLREGSDPGCNESIRLSRESDGVRTAVRFREGRILAPIAFEGNYKIPIAGCIGFRGWAQTAVELEFDAANQRMIARARVLDVSLNGTAGIGRSLLTRIVQKAIDERFNPLVIISADRLSYLFPLQPTGGLHVKAVGARHVVRNGAIDLFIAYEFIRT